MSHHSAIIKATPRVALLILDQFLWPVDPREHETENKNRQQSPDKAAVFETWRDSAAQVVSDELMVLAGVRWGNSVEERYVEREFPAREYHQLQSALHSTIWGKYRSLAEIVRVSPCFSSRRRDRAERIDIFSRFKPFLARLDRAGCGARMERLSEVEQFSGSIGHCSVVLVSSSIFFDVVALKLR